MSQFSQKIYNLLTKIPKGKVTTYKQIGIALNSKAYRAIGQVLKYNPDAPIVPCHRVVKSNGSIGGYMEKMSGESIDKKKKLLESEGIKFSGNNILHFDKTIHHFPS